MACNLIGTLGQKGLVSEFVASARAIFDGVRIVPVVDLDEAYAPDDPRNVVVIATRIG